MSELATKGGHLILKDGHLLKGDCSCCTFPGRCYRKYKATYSGTGWSDVSVVENDCRLCIPHGWQKTPGGGTFVSCEYTCVVCGLDCNPSSYDCAYPEYPPLPDEPDDCCAEVILVGGGPDSATRGIDGVYTFRTSGSFRMWLCQYDEDGNSESWGVTASFSFVPDSGVFPIEPFVLSASWNAHGSSVAHENCQCHIGFADATGTWTVICSHTGHDCCDQWQISAQSCDAIAVPCPSYQP